MEIINHILGFDSLNYTVVERKGIGHPDTLADGLSETISIAYSKYCLNKFGAILHHNFDKAIIRGGLFESNFGTGKMIEPITLVIYGRYSKEFGGEKIPFNQILKKSVVNYFTQVLPQFKEEYIVIENKATNFSHSEFWFKPRNLKDIPDQNLPHCNDTSLAIGYWPLIKNELISLSLEKSLYRNIGKPIYQNMGQDIKTMISFLDSRYHITMCIPLIGILTRSSLDYKKRLIEIRKILEDTLTKLDILKYELYINTADQSVKHEKYYLLHTGSCLEGGEEGVVGRGNSFLGFTSSERPHSAEATSGKNPQYFVGKVHFFFAQLIAYLVSTKHHCMCEINIVSQNGRSLFDPAVVKAKTSKKVSDTSLNRIINIVLERDTYRSQILKGAMIPGLGGENIDIITKTEVPR